jgi:hypothetical protein
VVALPGPTVEVAPSLATGIASLVGSGSGAPTPRQQRDAEKLARIDARKGRKQRKAKASSVVNADKTPLTKEQVTKALDMAREEMQKMTAADRRRLRRAAKVLKLDPTKVIAIESGPTSGASSVGGSRVSESPTERQARLDQLTLKLKQRQRQKSGPPPRPPPPTGESIVMFHTKAKSTVIPMVSSTMQDCHAGGRLVFGGVDFPRILQSVKDRRSATSQSSNQSGSTAPGFRKSNKRGGRKQVPAEDAGSLVSVSVAREKVEDWLRDTTPGNSVRVSDVGSGFRLLR